MNRAEAGLSLFIITVLGSVQYAFLGAVPDSVSDFSFIFITNLIGFGILLLLFRADLYRLNRNLIRQSAVLSFELLLFNLCLLPGSSGTKATISAGVLSCYFCFIPLILFLWKKEKPEKNTLAAIVLVLAGLFLMTNADVQGLWNLKVLYLLAADVFLAVYILSVEHFSPITNPSLLALGQVFFSCLFGLIGWAAESGITGASLRFPSDPAFWGSVLVIALFMRVLYSVVQIYAQRFIDAFTTSLIFSTEIIITMLLSPVLALLFGTEKESITPLRLAGALVMVLGILLSDGGTAKRLLRRFSHE